MKIRALIENVVPWQEWRICGPFRKLQNIGIDASWCWIPVGMGVEPDIDILVIPRIVVQHQDRKSVETWFNNIKANGTKLVYEVDDDIFSESYVQQLSKVYIKPDMKIHEIMPVIEVLDARREAALWTVNQCDAITVSTSVLGAYIKSICDVPVYVIPNALDVEKFNLGLKRLRKSSKITVGWAGGRRNISDLENMLIAWDIISKECNKVKFVFGGWMPPLDDYYNLKKKVEFREWTSKYAWNMQVDIGCCAVDDSAFASRKSPIKAWEYAIAGAAVVASTNLYGREPIISLADTVDEWVQLLLHYIHDEESRRWQNKLFTQHVYHYHNLDTEYLAWYEAYKRICIQGVSIESQTVDVPNAWGTDHAYS